MKSLLSLLCLPLCIASLAAQGVTTRRTLGPVAVPSITPDNAPADQDTQAAVPAQQAPISQPIAVAAKAPVTPTPVAMVISATAPAPAIIPPVAVPPQEIVFSSPTPSSVVVTVQPQTPVVLSTTKPFVPSPTSAPFSAIIPPPTGTPLAVQSQGVALPASLPATGALPSPTLAAPVQAAAATAPGALTAVSVSAQPAAVPQQVAVKDAVSAKVPAVTKTAYDIEVERLEALPPPSLPLRNTPLNQALRAITLYSGMNFAEPSEKDFSEKVNIHIASLNPWQLLTLLQRQHNFEMSFKDGVWEFFKVSPSEIVSRTYKLRYDTEAEVDQSNAGNGMSSNPTPPSSNGGQGSLQTASTGGSGPVFSSKHTKLLKDVADILSLPVNGITTISGGEASVAQLTGFPKSGPNGELEKNTANNSKVLYLEDSNDLLVFATRQQQQRVAEYLEDLDKKQPLIRIDALIVETSRDPRIAIGVDPTGYAASTVNIGGPINSAATAGSAASTAGTTGSSASTSGTTTTTPLATPSFDMNRLGTLALPTTAVLSASTLSFQLNALQQDSKSRVTNRPRLITTNNKEVSIESVIEEPYASSTTQQLGTGNISGGQVQTQITSIKIGTIINVLPRIMIDDAGKRSVQMNLVMTVSGKVSDKSIYGQLVPITSSRTYNYSVVVPDGMTLAIGGLDSMALSESVNKVPFAGDIPLVGYLFKSKSQEDNRSNLIAYLTPTIIDDKSGDMVPSEGKALPTYAQFVKETKTADAGSGSKALFAPEK